ncbi:ABC transporter substrate-binding protein [Actinomadura flavalba]|uniref:ABC transporter substrate-binding protein n=1 Tax=Actinomadura flavalba TaxID=1120938 RepID=UPI00035F51BD|nr:ABC transporter substrate-binding protein [Actinomadura flavalba]
MIRTIRPRVLLAALALVLAAGSAACGGDDEPAVALGPDGKPDLTKVTLRIGDQKGGLRALLGAAGELAKVPYKIEWKEFTSGPPLLEAVHAGALDVGPVGNAPPVFAAAAGSKIKVVAVSDLGLKGQAIVVPANSPLRNPAELKGKRVAVAKGSSAHYHLLTVLAKAGLSFKDIEPQYLAPPDALAAFSSGKLDAWAIWDPYTAQAEAQTKARTLVDGTGYTTGYNVLVAGDRALDDAGREAAIRDLVTRRIRALAWSTDKHKEWAKVWSKDTGLPLPVAEVAAQRRIAKALKIDDEFVRNEQALADAFHEQGLIPTEIDFAKFVDRRYNTIEVTP